MQIPNLTSGTSWSEKNWFFKTALFLCYTEYFSPWNNGRQCPWHTWAWAAWTCGRTRSSSSRSSRGRPAPPSPSGSQAAWRPRPRWPSFWKTVFFGIRIPIWIHIQQQLCGSRSVATQVKIGLNKVKRLKIEDKNPNLKIQLIKNFFRY